MSITTTTEKAGVMMSDKSQTIFKLKSFVSDMKDPFESSTNEKSVYLCAHNNFKTIYDFEVFLNRDNDAFFAHLNLGIAEAKNKAAALNKLSEWMKRAAETIDNAIKEGDL